MRSADQMTNRELWTLYQAGLKFEKQARRRYEVLQEMSRRLGYKMIIPGIPEEFSHWKLNGAGDNYR